MAEHAIRAADALGLETARSTTTRRVLVVLGMHRSGTSALTRVLSLLGAELPNHLMPALPGINETGFWESVEIADLNEEALVSAGSSWDSISAFPEAWFGSAAASSFRDRAIAILERDFFETPLFVLKDPRFCRLLPFWIEVFREMTVEPVFALILRNPLEVAASLRARDGFSTAKSLLLWLRHLLEAERRTRAMPRSFVAYEALLEDWRQIAERLSGDLGVSWPRVGSTAAGEIERFLSTRLRHHCFGSAELASQPEAEGWVERAYRACRRACEGRVADLPRILDEIRSELAAADRLFGTLIVEEHLRVDRLAELERPGSHRPSREPGAPEGGAAEAGPWAEAQQWWAAERRERKRREAELQMRLAAREFEVGRLTREIDACERRLVERGRELAVREHERDDERRESRRLLEEILSRLRDGRG